MNFLTSGADQSGAVNNLIARCSHKSSAALKFDESVQRNGNVRERRANRLGDYLRSDLNDFRLR